MIPRKLVTLGVLTILGIGGSFASDGWIVRQDGIGSAKIGMNLSQLNAALHEKCFGIHATSGVSYCELYAWCAAGSWVSGIREPINGVHGLESHSPSLRHSVSSIQDQVKKNLADLRGIHSHETEIMRERGDELDFFAEHSRHEILTRDNDRVF